MPLTPIGSKSSVPARWQVLFGRKRLPVMNEIGIDISAHRSKSADEFLAAELDYVITVCDHANQRCPVFPGPAKRLHWSIDDPVISGSESEQLNAFRRARDELQQRMRKFVWRN